MQSTEAAVRDSALMLGWDTNIERLIVTDSKQLPGNQTKLAEGSCR